MKRKGLIIGGAITAALAGTYFGLGNYFYNYALRVQKKKVFLEDNPHLALSKAIDPTIEEQTKEANKAFRKNHPPRSVTMFSTDALQLKLKADFYPQKETSSKWAITVHGYTGQAAEMVRWIQQFYEKDFHVLAPDLRGHGKSEGNYIGMGWHDRKDILGWIDWILARDPEAEIVLFGLSMGAATVMMTSGEELPTNVKVIVEDCGYSSVREVFEYQLNDLFGLPPFPVINAANTVAKIRAGYDLSVASAVQQVAKSKTPMLFIHGEQDSFVPFEMLDVVYQAAQVDKDRLIIQGAGHGESAMVSPDVYWKTVWNFVGKYIPVD